MVSVAMPQQEEHIFPCPVFEGSEKRISVCFAPAATSTVIPPVHGMRALTRPQLDALLDLAACQIVSTRNNEHFDAYVLSESSLFIYADRVVLKTCGTTKLLSCVPHLLELADSIGMTPSRVKYTRASFLFPEQQPAPHTSFEHECAYLHGLFSPSLGSGSAYVLGDKLRGLQWHTYVAGVGGGKQEVLTPTALRPRHTVEVCMTGLCPESASLFFRGDDFISSQHVTEISGIKDLLPGTDIDDYVFEPCGYSMNGLNDKAFITIHITPEEGFSYASVEVSGYDPDVVDVQELVAKVTEVFKPAYAAVALSTDSGHGEHSDIPKWDSSFAFPMTFDCHSASYQELKCGGHIAFFTLQMRKVNARTLRALSMRKDSTIPLDTVMAAIEAVEAEDADGRSNKLASLNTTKKMYGSGNSSDTDGSTGSPRAVLKHYPSFKTITSVATLKDMARDSATGSDTTSEHSTDRLSNSIMDSAELTFDDVVTLHSAMPLLKGDAATIDAHIRWIVDQHGLEDNLYVLDLGAVQRLYKAWGEALPRVHPHYAVKCNGDPALVSALAALGAGFDCASEAEVMQVLALGVSPDRIVFANPCKRPCDIRMANAKGVDLSTFDTESELHKLIRWAPNARVLLRIRADDPTARCQLGNKFGAEEYEWEHLLQAAKDLGVPVDGVSFHVGSGATNPVAFSYAVELARKAFDLGAAYGHDMKVLDIGGGFCGGRFGANGKVDLGGVPAALNAALDLHFPEDMGVKIIAEPGRFFAESVATMACLVFGRRSRPTSDGTPSFDYWITDGLYGSMNCLLYDHATLAPRPLSCNPGSQGPVHPSTVFGPTCDGLDTVVRDYALPEMAVGDWLVFPSMGAYTVCGASRFNGVNAVDVPTYYVCSQEP